MSTSNDPFESDEFKELADDAINNLLPKMQASSVVVSLVPTGPTDVKFSLELGFAIMLDKPIIAIVTPGAKVPEHLVRVADHIIEGDLSTPQGCTAVYDAISKLIPNDDNDDTKES